MVAAADSADMTVAGMYARGSRVLLIVGFGSFCFARLRSIPGGGGLVRGRFPGRVVAAAGAAPLPLRARLTLMTSPWLS